MVEEFMLLANCSVAEHIKYEFPQSAILRRHPAPPTSNFDPLVLAAKSRGLHLNVNSSKELADSLDKAIDPTDPMINTVLRVMSTRSMMQVLNSNIFINLVFFKILPCGVFVNFTIIITDHNSELFGLSTSDFDKVPRPDST